MIEKVVRNINERILGFTFFELSVLGLDKGTLIVAGSDDFIYYHNFEITFTDVFSFLGNFNWQVNYNGKPHIEVVGGDEAVRLNEMYYVETGNTIFKFNCNDNISTYIIAKSVSFNDAIVKYYAD